MILALTLVVSWCAGALDAGASEIPVAPFPTDTGTSFQAPLFTGWQERFHNLTTTRLAASDGFVWVAANEGLREYDLAKHTLARPANVPAGLGQAVVCDAVETWAAVDGAIYRRREGAWRREASPQFSFVNMFALDQGTLWVAAVQGLFRRGREGTWAPVPIPVPGVDAPQAKLISVAGDTAWAFSGSSRDGHHYLLARLTSEGVKTFGSPEGEPTTWFIKALAAQADGSVLVGFDETDAVHGRHFLRFDGATWTPVYGCALQVSPGHEWKPVEGCPFAWQVATEKELVFALESRFVRHPAPAPLETVTRLLPIGLDGGAAPLEPPGATGGLVGVATSSEGFWVLGESRLARLHDGRWTVFSAPDGDGVSTERAVGPAGLLQSTGVVLKPASKQQPVRRGVRPSPPRLGIIGGVALYSASAPDWVTGLANGATVTGADDYLPEFDRDGRYRFSGLYQEHGTRLDAVDATLGTVTLSRPLRAPEGALVDLVASPVFGPCTGEPCTSIRFAPLQENVRVAAPRRAAVAAVAVFHGRYYLQLASALGGGGGLVFAPTLEGATVGYDANRDRLFVHVMAVWGRSMLDLVYFLSPEGRLEEMTGRRSENPR